MSPAGRPLEPDFLRAVFDSAGAGLYVIDTAGRITACNPSAQQFAGRSEEEMLGRDLHDLLHRRPDGSEVPRDECRALAVLESGQPSQGSDEFLVREDDTLVPIIWASSPLRRAGRVEGAVVILHDFSLHRRDAEEAAARLTALEGLTERLIMVAEASAVLSSTLDVPKMLHRLVRLLVPELGDWAAVDALVPGESAEMQRIAVHTMDGTAEELLGPLPPLPDASPSVVVRAMREDTPLRLDADELAAEAETPLDQAHRELFRQLGGHSAIVVPLRTPRQVLGALTVARTGQPAPYTEAEVTVLADIGRRTGLVMEGAQLYDQQRHVAETMQRQLLTPLPQVDHLKMAARYRPAEVAAEIGGDWYDAFLLADGVMTMVIGDVVGHDLQAAAHMAEVRNMLRALAWDHQEPPSVIMRRLDEAMTNTSDAPMATAVFARIEGPEGGPWQLHWVNAGHPPPLLVTSDGHARFLEGGHGPLLGISSTLHLGLTWPDTREDLPPQSTLLFYTDGLVESRAYPIETGLANLRRHAAALARRDVEEFLDELLARIKPSGDDVALLVLRIPAAGAGAEGDESPAPPRHAHSPATPDRAAPGSLVEGTPVRDTSEPA
ncbi:SpoIIE family protein phosphatase [Streptomyces sp. NPDC051322]|uniref:SpoIIE family protein phosphatase n=1 Tax=Streptomyces sp. NPDC051322 TaxID=3154645 RepID=UPI00344E46BE